MSSYSELPGPPGSVQQQRSPWVNSRTKSEENSHLHFDDEETFQEFNGDDVAENDDYQWAAARGEDHSKADEVGGSWSWNSLNFEEFHNDVRSFQKKIIPNRTLL